MKLFINWNDFYEYIGFQKKEKKNNTFFKSIFIKSTVCKTYKIPVKMVYWHRQRYYKNGKMLIMVVYDNIKIMIVHIIA